MSDADLSLFPAPSRPRIWTEIAIVLGLSLGASAVYSVVGFLYADARARAAGQSIGSQSTSLNPSRSDYPLFDLAYQFFGIVFDLVPVALVIFLLWSTARPHLSRLGLSFDRAGRDALGGVALTLIIGVPGLGLYFAGRALGQTLDVQPAPLDTYWWTVPILLLSAFRAAAVEEVIMIGYLFDRLRALGWSSWAIIVATAVFRGSYHLYQGWPAFAGNVAMGLLFAWLYSRYGRLLPFVVAHFVIDAAVFVGYPFAVTLFPALFV